VTSQNQISANLSSDFSGDVVILGLKDGIYYELKEVGARIWDLIQKPRSIQAILDTLLEEYEVEAQQCEAHVLALAEDMAKRGLIIIK
jgi:adenine-specific DNA methylase